MTQMPVDRLEGVGDGAVERLHLLTSGTGEFFRRLGYADANRPSSSRPRSSRRLCGPRATYLVKDLG